MILKKKKKQTKFKQSSIPQFSFKSVGRQAQFSDHQEQKLWLQSKLKKKKKYFHLQHENTENSSKKENYQSLLPAKLR